MAGRDNSKLLPSSGSVKRTKDDKGKEDHKTKAIRSGEVNKPNPYTSKVEKPNSGKAADEHNSASGQGTSSGQTHNLKPGQNPLLDMFKVEKHVSGNVYLPPKLWKK